MYRPFTIGIIFNILVLFLTGQYLLADDSTDKLEITNKIVVVKTIDPPNPVTLFGTPGTTVIWINHSKHPVKVVFIEKQVVLACGSPINFVVNKAGVYESNKIPSGGTASLCFTEKGRYPYKTIPSKKIPLGKKAKEHFGTVWIK